MPLLFTILSVTCQRPMLTPIVLFFALYPIHRLFRSMFPSVNSAFVTFVLFGVVGYATYVNYTEGPARLAAYLEKKGVETEAAVVSSETVQSFVRIGFTTSKVIVNFRDQSDVMRKFSYLMEERRFFPEIEEDAPAPAAGDRIRIRYLPKAEGEFMIMTSGKTSSYAIKLACHTLRAALKRDEAKYRFEEPPSGPTREQLATTLDSIFDLGCLEEGSIETYRALRKRLN